MFGIFSRNSLIAAAEKGDIRKLKMLIEEKGTDVNVRDNEDRTPLHVASFRGQIEAVKLLIEKGAEVNVRSMKDGITPLFLVYLAKKNAAEIAKLLIENGADVNDRSKATYSILHNAAGEGNIELVEALIDKGADINIRDKNGGTPLHIAIIEEQYQIVCLLVEKGADIEAKIKFNKPGAELDGVEMTALQLAITGDNDLITEFLIKNGADLNATMHVPRGRMAGKILTPYKIAVECGNEEIAEMIRKAGGK